MMLEAPVGELLAEAGPALGVDGDRQRGVELLRPALSAPSRNSVVPSLRSAVNASSLATEWVITDGWLRAALTVRSTWATARLRSSGIPEQVRAVVALPDGRLVPHHDPRAVQPAQQPLAEHVVGARHVGAQLLELAHDRVEVGRR